MKSQKFIFNFIKYPLLFYLALSLYSCQKQKNEFSNIDFERLMNNLASGWSTQNTELAIACFDEDAVYMEPPNIQYYRGHRQLKPYFDALDDTYKMEFHNLTFNKKTQIGAGEYTFSYGEKTSDVGVVVVELEDGKIKFWREYQQKGPTDFEQFKAVKGKDWKWHIGNYPAPQDTIIPK